LVQALAGTSSPSTVLRLIVSMKAAAYILKRLKKTKKIKFKGTGGGGHFVALDLCVGTVAEIFFPSEHCRGGICTSHPKKRKQT
jgi:hypothetical protein